MFLIDGTCPFRDQNRIPPRSCVVAIITDGVRSDCNRIDICVVECDVVMGLGKGRRHGSILAADVIRMQF